MELQAGLGQASSKAGLKRVGPKDF